MDGVPTFRSIGAALTGMPANGGARAVVFIRNGRYREKLTVDRPRVTLLGESHDGTVMTFDAAADTPTPTGGTYGTRGSFTLRVVAPDFRAENITIENAFDYPANAAKPDSSPTRFRNPQAVALTRRQGVQPIGAHYQLLAAPVQQPLAGQRHRGEGIPAPQPGIDQAVWQGKGQVALGAVEGGRRGELEAPLARRDAVHQMDPRKLLVGCLCFHLHPAHAP